MPQLAERDLRIQLAKHLLCVIQKETPSRIAATYISSLFDCYAKSFEKSLENLSYQVPQLLIQAILWSQEELCHLQRILDLGAGTGLLGEQLKDLAPRAHIAAVDLSAEMLKQAEMKGCYDELHCADLLDHLADCTRSVSPFDLIVAADVFGYVGDLAPVFRLVYQNLDNKGLFVFSTEKPTGNETVPHYQLQASGRVAHSHEYVLTVAREHGFKVLRDWSCELRAEDGHPVLGHVFSLSCAL
ncbi:bioC [Symbiodinium pilosum]|uniref:BioC protein n=1 Tax=Symbiodinium pilosum TaxID=2952 RepID=A0A812XK71_SYMPI|nr:bioC [Symbiodinium pilosum]